MRPVQSQHVTSRGTVWRIAGKGPALLLLHGGAGSWSHWVRNIDALGVHHTLWIPDLPGMGDSPLPPEPRDHAAIAAVLAQDAEQLLPHGERMDIAGFSFGGIVAAWLAGLLPGRVRRLVLVGAGGLGLRPRGERILKAWKHLKDAAEIAAVHRHNFAALMVRDAAGIDDATLALYAADVRRARVNSARSSRTAELRAKLVELRLPVHGIWGRQDVTAHAKFDEIRAILRAAYPQAELQVIEDAGHWVQHEQAEAFNRALRNLLADA